MFGQLAREITHPLVFWVSKYHPSPLQRLTHVWLPKDKKANHLLKSDLSFFLLSSIVV
jgi:hypothetical protein